MIIAVEVSYFISSNDKPDHMAFLSTVDDNFIKIDGEQLWDSWAYLCEVCDDQVLLDQLRPLCPAWFFEEKKET